MILQRLLRNIKEVAVKKFLFNEIREIYIEVEAKVSKTCEPEGCNHSF